MNLRAKYAGRSGGASLRGFASLRMAVGLAAALMASMMVTAQEAVPPADLNPPATTIAIVPTDSSATITGALRVSEGRTLIGASGSISSADKVTDVVLPHRGVLRVCASTTVKLAADVSVVAGETPGLLMAIDHGAIEASFATARNSDILLTPDFRILMSGPGASEVKVRLGQHGDTCVDNPKPGSGQEAPYVVVTSIFDGGAYRVQPGQRVMFQHGSLQEVVDQEKEPCGCPAPARPGSNEFPAAESAGLAPLAPAIPPPATRPAPPREKQPPSEPLVYQAAPAAQAEPAAQAALDLPTPQAAPIAEPSLVPAPAKRPSQPGFFRRVGRFFKRIFGAE